MYIGIFTGAIAAFCLAWAYVFSGMSVRRNKDVGAFSLLCRGHVVSGILSVIGLAFCWTPQVIYGFSHYIIPLIFCIGFYLLGQFSLFMAQRTVDASRVVPLLGLKLIVLASLNTLFLPLIFDSPKEVYGIWQWLGMALTLGSAFLLNNAGSRIPLWSLFWVCATCIGYALSDTSIAFFVKAFRELGESSQDPMLAGVARPSIVAAFTTYIVCGIVSVFCLPLFKLPPTANPRSVWTAISPFAASWLISMLFLYACFAHIGTVNGNIVQSTRGIIAILIGAALSKLGFNELEEKINLNIFIRRLIAGIMMILAIVAFNKTS